MVLWFVVTFVALFQVSTKSLLLQWAFVKSLLSAHGSSPLLLQRGTWSVTALAVHTLKSLHSQCAFVKPLLSAHVSARCFYSRYVVSHRIRGAHAQVTAQAVRM